MTLPGESISSVPLLIGTSGWQYRDWRGGLYPAGVAQRRWLEHYASQYLTVENNNSFYRLPAPQTFAGWRERTPGDFVMTVKASRYLTHVRRLRDPARTGRPAAGRGRGARPQARPDPAPAAADPRRRTRPASGLPGRIPARPAPRRPRPAPDRGGAAARVVVDRKKSSRSWPPTTPRCAGPTGAAARSRRCGAPPGGDTCAFTRGQPTRGPATASRRCGPGWTGCGRRGRGTRTCTCTSTTTRAGPPSSTPPRSPRWPARRASRLPALRLVRDLGFS